MIVDGAFCSWDARSLFFTCVMIFQACVALLLFSIILIAYWKARRVLNQGVLKFYHLMMVWGLCFVGKNTFSIIIFFTRYFHHADQQGEEWMQHLITRNSKIYQLLYALSGVMVQTLLLMISLHILGNMLTYNLLRDERIKRMYNIGKGYFWIRAFIILFPSVLLFGGFELEVVEILSLVKNVLIVSDCFVCLFFLFLIRRKGTSEYSPINANFIQPLERQLRILTFATISRVIINILYFLGYPLLVKFYLSSKYTYFCFYDEGTADGYLYFTISNILLVDYVMHFLPVFTIRKMYEPPPK